MTRVEAQKRSADIRHIRGCYALLTSTLGAGAPWMEEGQKDSLRRIVFELGDIVRWLDSIRTEKAAIRAGDICEKCKKKRFEGTDRCECWMKGDEDV